MTDLSQFPITRRWPAQHPDRIQLYSLNTPNGVKIGIMLEEKIAIGYASIRVISRIPALDLIKQLQAAGHGVTHHTAEGSTGTVEVIYTIIKRTELQATISLINEFNPKAFFTIEEVKTVNEGIHRFTAYQKNVLFRRGRKGK